MQLGFGAHVVLCKIASGDVKHTREEQCVHNNKQKGTKSRFQLTGIFRISICKRVQGNELHISKK